MTPLRPSEPGSVSHPPARTPLLEGYFARLERLQPWRWRGRVLQAVGQTIESAGPLASVGECCEITDQAGHAHLAEVIGFRGSNVLSMPVETTQGIRFGDEVAGLGVHAEIGVGPALLGRVLNSLGQAIDSGPAPATTKTATGHREQAALVRKLMAVYARSEDLVRIGAYKPGSDPELDRAIEARGALREFLTQDAHEQASFQQCVRRLSALAAEI